MTTDSPTSLKSLPGIAQFRMDKQTAIVTGGSKGLGAAMAAGLASAGANIVIASRDLNEGQAIALEIAEGFGVETLAVAADVTLPADVKALVAATMERFRRIDILLNSAGINIRGSIESLSYEQFQEVQKQTSTAHGSAARL